MGPPHSFQVLRRHHAVLDELAGRDQHVRDARSARRTSARSRPLEHRSLARRRRQSSGGCESVGARSTRRPASTATAGVRSPRSLHHRGGRRLRCGSSRPGRRARQPAGARWRRRTRRSLWDPTTGRTSRTPGTAISAAAPARAGSAARTRDADPASRALAQVRHDGSRAQEQAEPVQRVRRERVDRRGRGVSESSAPPAAVSARAAGSPRRRRPSAPREATVPGPA